MSKIGITVAQNSLNAPLALHFGKTKWILIYESAESFEFIRNEKLVGRNVVDLYQEAGCSDVIVNNIGSGAMRNLKAAGIQAWHGSLNIPARKLIATLKQGALKAAT